MTDTELAHSRARITIPFQTHGGIRMQRDMEVVRKVLRAVQQKTDTLAKPLKVDGVDEATAMHHIALLTKAGYIDGVVHAPVGGGVDLVLVKDLTWEGHEFAGAILTEDGVWEKIKDAIGPDKLATMPLKLIQDVATKAIGAWAMARLGL